MEIVEDSDESYNNNGKPWKSSRILRVKPNLFIFLCSSYFSIFHFSHFFFFFSSFHFFQFFIFQFFHFPVFSFSFFFFFLLFFFFFSGLLEIRFFGLNCFKISCNISKKKIICLNRLGGYLFGPSFLFFSSFFFSVIFFFFLKKNFLVLFSNFSQEKSFFFSFSCISFKYVLLLASVSDFNCFLRSRCSMEVWCPDSMG